MQVQAPAAQPAQANQAAQLQAVKTIGKYSIIGAAAGATAVVVLTAAACGLMGAQASLLAPFVQLVTPVRDNALKLMASAAYEVASSCLSAAETPATVVGALASATGAVAGAILGCCRVVRG